MAHILTFVALPCALGAGMLLLLEAGRHMGVRRRQKNPEAAAKESGAVEAAILGSWVY